MLIIFIFFFKQKTAYEMRISDWSSDVCSSDLHDGFTHPPAPFAGLLQAETQRGDHHLAFAIDRHLIGLPRNQTSGVTHGLGDQYLPLADRKSTRLNSSH